MSPHGFFAALGREGVAATLGIAFFVLAALHVAVNGWPADSTRATDIGAINLTGSSSSTAEPLQVRLAPPAR